MNFYGKNVIVTGGASGIGKAISATCASLGGTVLIADLNLPLAMETCNEIGVVAKAFRIDMSKPEDIRIVVNEIIAEVGRIDVLVNCAGITSTSAFEDLSQAEWDRTIAINLTGTFAMTQSVFKHMKENGGGRILNISSVAAKLGGGLLGTSAYAASKAGVIGFTKAVSREGAPFNISCNALCPSLTKTPMTTNIPNELWERIIDSIPLKRAADPQEIANAACFLASDDASFITGETMVVDGGICKDG